MEKCLFDASHEHPSSWMPFRIFVLEILSIKILMAKLHSTFNFSQQTQFALHHKLFSVRNCRFLNWLVAIFNALETKFGAFLFSFDEVCKS